MTKAQRIILWLIAIWWIIGGGISLYINVLLAYSSSSIDSLVKFVFTGLFLTVPLIIIFYAIKPDKGK